MKIRFTLLALTAFLAFNTIHAQSSINDYKYVVVPNKFEFLNAEDQFRLNTLTKLLFEKYGFTALMEGETLPDDAAKNNCLALNSDVIKEKGMFNTKLKIQLKNCKNEIVYTSNVGQSREKKFQVAYNLALREAFKSFETTNYSYKENEAIVSNVTPKDQESQAEVEQLKEEIRVLKEEKKAVAETPKPEQLVKAEVDEVVAPSPQVSEVSNVLYAQKTTNGFQLVDSTPKVIYKIKKTGMTNVYLVEGREAVIYQLDTNWVIEYYENKVLKTKILNIKF